MGKVYRQCRFFFWLAFVSGSSALALGVFACSFKGMRFLTADILAGTAAVVSVLCFLKRNRLLAKLAARLIELDLPALPAGVTLYQLGEIYARQYHLPSLVDVIGQWNSWMRGTVILVYFATFGVFFLSFPLMLFWTGAACLGVLGALWVSFGLRRGG